MSKNIDQVYIANPITSNTSTDLMYFGQSPYTTGDDAAMTYANFSAQFVKITPAADQNITVHNLNLTNIGNVRFCSGNAFFVALSHIGIFG